MPPATPTNPATPAAPPPPTLRSPAVAAVLAPQPPEISVETPEQLAQLVSEVPPSFTLPDNYPNRFTPSDAQRRKARAAYTAALRFADGATDPGRKAEFQEIAKTLTARLQPIDIIYLRALLDGIPVELQDLKRDQIDMLKVNVALGIQEAEFYLTAYPQAKELNDVRVGLARLLFLNCEVAQKNWEDAQEKARGSKPSIEERIAHRDSYFKRLLAFLDEAEKDPALADNLKQRSLKLRADTFAGTDNPAKAAECYVELLKKWSSADEVKSGLTYVNAVQQYLYAELPEKAEEIGRQAMATCDNTKYYPHLADFQFKALTATGKLEEAEALWLKLMPVFGAREKELNRPEFERNGYRTYYDWALFRLGYVAFALLRHEQAKDYFKQHLEYVNDVTASGKPISPPLQVFAQRSKYLLDVLQTKIGNPAPELNLEKLWANNRPFSLAANQGKVIAIIFRSTASSRVDPTLLYLQRQYEKYGQDLGPFAVISVAFLKGMNDIPEQMEALEKEMKTLNLTFPAGYDPTPKRSVFSEYDVNIGSATLVFVDPLGRLAYYEQDPRPNAFGLFTRVIEGLLKG